jgi:hypothetical protein
LPACCRIAAKRSTTVAHCLPRAGEIFSSRIVGAATGSGNQEKSMRHRRASSTHISLVSPQTSAVKIEL